jgi:hypothetical protein
LDLVDKKHAKLERLFYKTLHETPPQDSWGTRVCELHDTLQTSKDILQAEKIRWYLQQKNVQLFGGKN